VTAAAAFKARAERGEPLVGAFLYVQDGADPATDRVVSEPAIGRTLFVPVPDQSAAASVATELVDGEGVEIIELYRGIGPAAAAEVIDAVGDRVPVGTVLYEGRLGDPTRVLPVRRRAGRVSTGPGDWWRASGSAMWRSLVSVLVPAVDRCLGWRVARSRSAARPRTVVGCCPATR